jgi:hypothetical protein
MQRPAPLDEVMGRFHAATAWFDGAGARRRDPNQLYDQAAQGPHPGAPARWRSRDPDFVARYPTLELSDNAQYGIMSATSQSEVRQRIGRVPVVESRTPPATVPAAMYKRALCEEKLGHTADLRSLEGCEAGHAG